MSLLPFFQSIYRRAPVQCLLWNEVIISLGIVDQRLFQFLRTVKACGIEYVTDSAIESFDHAVRLRVSRPDQTVLNAIDTAYLIKYMVTGSLALPSGDKSICELLAIVC